MKKEEIGILKKIIAHTCHNCPLCSYGRKYPDSVIGKVVHSKLHTDICPLWKAEKEVFKD